MNFLQINLGRGKQAQDLLMQVAREKDIDILLICEQYKKPSSAIWYQDKTSRAAIVGCSDKVRFSNFYETDKGYVWVETGKVRIYSCYFSPNDALEKFMREIDELEKSLRSARGEVIIAGDFNSKAQEWGETRFDRRGRIVCEFLSRNDLIILNEGREPTFRRSNAASIIDLTLASPNISKYIREWGVLDVETLSDHRYITFSMTLDKGAQKRTTITAVQKTNTWNTRKLDEERLRRFLEELKLIEELEWTCKRGTPEDTVRATRETIISACNAAMPKRKNIEHRKHIYWWTTEIDDLRRGCLASRRRATRSRGNVALKEQYKQSRRKLKRAIKKSQRRCWLELIEEVENDPWGTAYKIVSRKLRSRCKTPGLHDPEWVRRIIEDLFPSRDNRTRKKQSNPVVKEEELFTLEELQREGTKLKAGKSPGLDGIPNEVIKLVIKVYPEMLLIAFNICLKHGMFLQDWKKQKLILLKKGNKPLDQTSSYRPLCLLDTMGKLLEGLILRRLEEHLKGENSLSNRQFGFRKGKSTTDAIMEVITIADTARRGNGGKKGFCALIAIDIKNAFNTVRWEDIFIAMIKKKVPEYLLRIIADYLSDRTVIYQEEHRIEGRMTCGVPQGSRIGPFLWNIVYDGLLEMDMPANTSLIGFADDTIIACCGTNVDIIEIRANEALLRVKRWLDSRQLQMAIEKTDAVLITDRRPGRLPRIVIDGVQIAWKKHIRYLGVELDHRLKFGPHINSMASKASEVGNYLSRLMPNNRGPKEAKRRLLASVVHSKMLYAAPVWAKALEKQAIKNKFAAIQRCAAMRVTSAYRTVSECAVGVLARMPPIDLLALEREEVYKTLKGGFQEHLDPMEIVKKNARKLMVQRWQKRWDEGTTGRWTYKLIPQLTIWLEREHGQVNFYLTQVLSGHGCFKSYLARFKIVDNAVCNHCGMEEDNAMHTLFDCNAWSTDRDSLREKLGLTLTAENMVKVMISCKENWSAIEEFVTKILKIKETSTR